MTAHDKEYRFYRISQGKSCKTIKTKEGDQISRVIILNCLKCLVSEKFTKHTHSHTHIHTHTHTEGMVYTQEKRCHRNCPWGSPNVGFIKDWTSYFKYLQITKGNHLNN